LGGLGEPLAQLLLRVDFDRPPAQLPELLYDLCAHRYPVNKDWKLGKEEGMKARGGWPSDRSFFLFPWFSRRSMRADDPSSHAA
jgi:hypothetical protein